jgi:hypothetical protein
VTALDVRDPSRLEATLLAVPEGTWVVVHTADGEMHRVQRVPGGGLYLPGDLTIHCGDLAHAEPRAVRVIDTDREALLMYVDATAEEASALLALGGDEQVWP